MTSKNEEFRENHAVQNTTPNDPACAYLLYLDAVARRDVRNIRRSLTDNRARYLPELLFAGDVSVDFDRWCEIQADCVTILDCQTDGKAAMLHASGITLLRRVNMLWFDGRWQIDSEFQYPASLLTSAKTKLFRP